MQTILCVMLMTNMNLHVVVKSKIAGEYRLKMNMSTVSMLTLMMTTIALRIIVKKKINTLLIAI